MHFVSLEHPLQWNLTGSQEAREGVLRALAPVPASQSGEGKGEGARGQLSFPGWSRFCPERPCACFQVTFDPLVICASFPSPH